MPVEVAAGPKDSSGAPEEEDTEAVLAFMDAWALSSPGCEDGGTDTGAVEAAAAEEAPPEDADADDEDEAGGRRALNPASKAAAVLVAARLDARTELAAPPPTRLGKALARALEVQLENN